MQIESIKTYAKDLVLTLAFHLAERIATLMRQVLDHPTKVLYDPENEVLFLPQFWLLPIYRELLNTASTRLRVPGLVATVKCAGQPVVW